MATALLIFIFSVFAPSTLPPIQPRKGSPQPAADERGGFTPRRSTPAAFGDGLPEQRGRDGAAEPRPGVQPYPGMRREVEDEIDEADINRGKSSRHGGMIETGELLR